jgi:hypothetical protein
LLLVDIFIIQSTVSLTRGMIAQPTHIFTFEPALYIFVSFVVREEPFQNGVAHNIQSCKNQVVHVGHVGQSGHIHPTQVAHVGHVGQAGHISHVAHLGQMSQSAQSAHVAQVGQAGHISPVAQIGQGNQLVQFAHVAQAGHISHVAQIGQGNHDAHCINVFNTKIISQLLSIHNIFSTPVRSLASFRFNLSVYNFILVHVFISNNLSFILSVQSIDTIILFMVCTA